MEEEIRNFATTWLADNPNAWKMGSNGKITWLIPTEQVPEYVLKSAEVHEKRVKRSMEQNKIVHTMGLSGMNEDWD